MEELKEPTFEEIVTRLETIAACLEGDEVQLEQALAWFEEGVRLSRQGTKRLDQAEKRLEVLLERDVPESFEPEALVES